MLHNTNEQGHLIGNDLHPNSQGSKIARMASRKRWYGCACFFCSTWRGHFRAPKDKCESEFVCLFVYAFAPKSLNRFYMNFGPEMERTLETVIG